MIDFIARGDCRDILPTLETDSVDIGFTSPPYNRKRNDKYAEYDDDIEDYFSFLCEVIDQMMRICKRHVFFNIQATYYQRKDIYRLIGKYADVLQNIIIWNKKNPMPAAGTNITNAYEFILVFGTESLQSNNTYTQNFISTSVNNEMPDEHKAVMSIEVADWVIKNFTNLGEVILDPFFGTGTTGVSAKKHGRHYIGIEIIEKYADYAKSRIEGTSLSNPKQINIDDIINNENLC